RTFRQVQSSISDFYD
nr:Chain B, Type II secretion system protein D [Dickeya dadantii 3937]